MTGKIRYTLSFYVPDPAETNRALDKIKDKHGLKSRSEALRWLIEKELAHHPPEERER